MSTSPFPSNPYTPPIPRPRTAKAITVCMVPSQRQRSRISSSARHLPPGRPAPTRLCRRFGLPNTQLAARNLTDDERFDAVGRRIGKRELAVHELHHVLVPVVHASKALRARSARRPCRLKTQVHVLRRQKLVERGRCRDRSLDQTHDLIGGVEAVPDLFLRNRPILRPCVFVAGPRFRLHV